MPLLFFELSMYQLTYAYLAIELYSTYNSLMLSRVILFPVTDRSAQLQLCCEMLSSAVLPFWLLSDLESKSQEQVII